MAEYKKYLASSILTEDKVVTYRLLSRVLKVHVNTAKEMLYDFHRNQNAKKPGTIHATYLISGTKRSQKATLTPGGIKKDGEDDYMQSSPFMGSFMPQPDEGTGESSVLSITLVKEENLEEIKSQYEQISSIHIYSLAPHPLKDLQLLTDVTRQIQNLTASEDPLENYPKYGSITNPSVRRRTAKRPLPPASIVAPSKPKPEAIKPKVAEPKPAPKKTERVSSANDFFGKSNKTKSKEKEMEKEDVKVKSAPSSKESTPAPDSNSNSKPANLKRDNSTIFKAFAKAKPKIQRQDTDSSAVVDSPMGGMDDDDDEEETWVPEPKKEKETEANKDRKTRKEREEALNKMMEDAEKEEAVKKELEEKEKEKEKEKSTSVEPKEKEKEEVPVVATGGKRRGRRRVMKKRTFKDEGGYLVTEEKPEWESFSEDEASVPPPKAKVHHALATSTKSKKGAAAKQGQGSIMSFFGKK